MKYDCYPRFIKCDDYAKLWDLVDKGQPFKELKEIFLDNLDLIKAESVRLFFNKKARSWHWRDNFAVEVFERRHKAVRGEKVSKITSFLVQKYW